MHVIKQKYCMLAAFCLSVVLGPVSAKAQTSAVDTTFIMNPDFGIHAESLGGSYPSDTYDSQSMNSNPASLLALYYPDNLVLHHYYSERTKSIMDNMSIPVFIGAKNAFAVNVGYRMGGNTSFESSLGLPTSPDPPLKFSEFGLNLGYAHKVAQNLSLGTLVTARHARTSMSKAWSETINFGLIYNPDPSVTYGFVYRGLGSRLIYRYDRTNGITSVRSVNSPDFIAIGLTLHFLPSFTSNEPFFNLTFSNEKQFGIKGLKYNGGIEFNPVRYLSLRFGYYYGLGLSGTRFGIGLHFPGFQLAYLIAPSSRTVPFSQQLALSVSLGTL